MNGGPLRNGSSGHRRTTVGVLAGLGAASGLTGAIVLADLPLVGWFSVCTALASAAACGFAALRTRGSMRFSWIMFALLIGCYALGDTLWLVYSDATGSPPILSLADAMYLVALVPAVLGLLSYPVLRGLSSLWRPLLLDALVVVLAVLALSHALVLREVAATAGSFLDVAALAVYPVTDGVLAALSLVLLVRSVGQTRPDVVLIGLTFAVYLVADNAYAVMAVRGSDTLGTWVDAGYAVAPLFLAAAALLAALTPTPRRWARRHVSGVVAPLVPDLTALAALAVAGVGVSGNTTTRWLSLALLAGVGVRQLAQTASGQELRRRLEERIEERNRELDELAGHYRRLDAMKYQFVTSVSHELRTPLTAIRGSLEMLHDGDVGAMPSHVQSMVAVAMRGSERLTRLVNDIIDLERLESGSFGFNPGPTALGPLAEEAVASLQPLADEHGVRLVAEPGTALADCDPDRVVQVLVNLLGNALRFAPRGSAVTVTIDDGADEVTVSVTDAGRGIPDDQLEAVFGRFHQVEPAADPEQGGTGLGLAICHGIVTAHGGRIWAESPGRGATFRFTLPRASAQMLVSTGG